MDCKSGGARSTISKQTSAVQSIYDTPRMKDWSHIDEAVIDLGCALIRCTRCIRKDFSPSRYSWPVEVHANPFFWLLPSEWWAEGAIRTGQYEFPCVEDGGWIEILFLIHLAQCTHHVYVHDSGWSCDTEDLQVVWPLATGSGTAGMLSTFGPIPSIRGGTSFLHGTCLWRRSI
jgi:hypothetical protein